MEEYIRLEEEKARRRGKVYNWKTAMYGKIWYDDDIHDLRSVETEFPAIVFNDELTYEKALSYEPINLYVSFGICDVENPKQFMRYVLIKEDAEGQGVTGSTAKTLLTTQNLGDHFSYLVSSLLYGLPPRDQRHQYLRFEGLQYTDADITDFEKMLGKIHEREVHRVQVFNFGGLTDLMADGLSGRMLIKHKHAQGHDFFALERKRRAMISEGQFFSRLAEHFGLLTKERLRGLTVIVRDLPVIDMAELVRLQICKKLDDTWAWVVLGPERQHDVAVGAPRLARVEEEVHEIREALGEQREVMDAIDRYLSRFTVWATGGISQLLDSAGATYVRYFRTHVPYQRCRVRQRTEEANILAAPLDENQLDP
ncbi:hypothetical protein Tco_0774750 [Tanacetum coccineum]|uniref:Uncharacterized protein n=1 Tax=Tanacetum coccineum TaxID=301880 RepID=A0ABQ4ZPC8_9ASTR